MTRRSIVLDTNVLISSIFNPDSPPAQILRAVIGRAYVIYVSHAILAEYEDVIWRPKFDHLSEESRHMAISVIRKVAIIVNPSFHISAIASDPDDNRFLECAISAKADFLITGNTRHFPMGEYHGVRIVTARTFLDIVRQEEAS